MTNFEYISGLDERGIAKLLAFSIDCNICRTHRVKNCSHCYKEWLEWLKEEYNSSEMDVLLEE